MKSLVGVKKILADDSTLVPTVMWFLHFHIPVTPIEVPGNYNTDFTLAVKLLLLCTGKLKIEKYSFS